MRAVKHSRCREKFDPTRKGSRARTNQKIKVACIIKRVELSNGMEGRINEALLHLVEDKQVRSTSSCAPSNDDVISPQTTSERGLFIS